MGVTAGGTREMRTIEAVTSKVEGGPPSDPQGGGVIGWGPPKHGVRWFTKKTAWKRVVGSHKDLILTPNRPPTGRVNKWGESGLKKKSPHLELAVDKGPRKVYSLLMQKKKNPGNPEEGSVAIEKRG